MTAVTTAPSTRLSDFVVQRSICREACPDRRQPLEFAALRESAYDPKRTLGDPVRCDAQQPSFDVIGCRPRAWKRLMRRRDFITLLGSGAVTWPLAARAQQSGLPVIGFLNPSSLEARREYVAAFHQGLAEAGYAEGRNVRIEYRWAEGQNDRLPFMAANLVQQQVSVIVATDGTATALAAKAATGTIPIIFLIGADPVELGLVASLSRPGGNITGVAALAVGTVAKRLQLLHELVPSAAKVAFLRNPANRFFSALETKELQAAANALGVSLLLLNASS
jgi:putative tryptophan/tyrosine transport system substrate-binding protein